MPTKIEWTDEVWNPVTGCTKVSQGCKNCYAETIANRFWGERKFTDVICHEDRLAIPLRWRKPRRVFVNSMSDLFHPDVPDEFIDKVFDAMLGAPHHTYQVLTKRPERMFSWMQRAQELWMGWVPSWVWLGVSVENQATALQRISWLLRTSAAVRFVSYEPALSPIDLTQVNHIIGDNPVLGGIDWLICGGESGPKARPMHPDWAKSVRDQCQAAGVAFFFKQMMVNGEMVKLPELDGKQWIVYPKGG